MGGGLVFVYFDYDMLGKIKTKVTWPFKAPPPNYYIVSSPPPLTTT